MHRKILLKNNYIKKGGTATAVPSFLVFTVAVSAAFIPASNEPSAMLLALYQIKYHSTYN